MKNGLRRIIALREQRNEPHNVVVDARRREKSLCQDGATLVFTVYLSGHRAAEDLEHNGYNHHLTYLNLLYSYIQRGSHVYSTR